MMPYGTQRCWNRLQKGQVRNRITWKRLRRADKRRARAVTLTA